MSLDPVLVNIALNTVKKEILSGSDPYQTYLWTLFFKIDGDTVTLGADLKLHGSATVVGWIEARGAKPGARVEVPEHGGLWRVAAVFEPPLDARWLQEKRRIDRKGMPTA